MSSIANAPVTGPTPSSIPNYVPGSMHAHALPNYVPGSVHPSALPAYVAPHASVHAGSTAAPLHAMLIPNAPIPRSTFDGARWHGQATIVQHAHAVCTSGTGGAWMLALLVVIALALVAVVSVYATAHRHDMSGGATPSEPGPSDSADA